MAPETRYFTQNDWTSEHLPDVTWERMLDEHIVLSPSVLINVLGDAAKFLSTADGPHLLQRKEFVPSWFNFWHELLLPQAQIAEGLTNYPFVGHLGVRTVGRVADYVKKRSGESGVQNMGGGEGTEGHLASYTYMRKVLGEPSTVVWAFEQDSYFARHKERRLPFLPLPVRLSMAVCLGVDVVTVYPEAPDSPDANVLNNHYLRLFRMLGVGYSFADELDPYVDTKSQRGRTDRPTIIPHLDVPSTRERVERLRGDMGYRVGRHSTLPREDIDEVLRIVALENYAEPIIRSLADGVALR